jgi:prepilin-type N-terminal cleavage/methylation domain
MNKKSFSLIEVLVFVSILSVFFVAALTVSVYYLRMTKSQQYKIIATHLAEEAVEWLKSEKESDWLQFVSYDTSTSYQGTKYCLKNLNWSTDNPCPETSAIFKRELLIKNIGNPGDPVSQVEADITVSWLENNGENKVSLKTVLTVLE